jgi:biopolymer transport protein ExbB
MRTRIDSAMLAFLVALAARGVAAAERDPELDAVLEDKDKVLQTEMEQTGPGDLRKFTVITDEDAGALEVGDIYKSNGSFFKIVYISYKGASGGKFTAERSAGKFDPSRTWSRVSGLGPLTLSTRETLLSLYLSGGFIMHPIAFILLVVIVITISNFWVYRYGRHCPLRFVEASRQAIAKGDIEQFEGLALRERGLFAAICRAMVMDFRTSSIEDIRSRCESRAMEQITRLRIPLKVLNFSAAIAPLLGLLGTVVGLVMAFESVQYEAASAAKSQALAAGVRVALFTTVGGLSVAIPALCVYFFFSQKLNLIAARCEGLATEFVQQLAVLKRLAGELVAVAPENAPAPTEKQP